MYKYLFLVALCISIPAFAVNPRRKHTKKAQQSIDRYLATKASESIYCPELNCWSVTDYFAEECVQHGPTAVFLDHLAHKNMREKAADKQEQALPALLQANNHTHNTSPLYTIAGFVQGAHKVSKDVELEQALLYLSCDNKACMNVTPFKSGPAIHIPLEPVEASFFKRALKFVNGASYALYQHKDDAIEVGLFYSWRECIDASPITSENVMTMRLKPDKAAMLARAAQLAQTKETVSIYCPELNCWSLKAACLLHSTTKKQQSNDQQQIRRSNRQRDSRSDWRSYEEAKRGTKTMLARIFNSIS